MENVIVDVMMLNDPVDLELGCFRKAWRRVLGYVVAIVPDSGMVRGLPIQMIDTEVDKYKEFPIQVILNGNLNLGWSAKVIDYEPGLGVLTTASMVAGVLLEPEEVVFVGSEGEPGDRVVKVGISSLRLRLIGPKGRATVASKRISEIKRKILEVI